MYDPIIGSFIHSLDNAASDIHVPISLLLIQILDIIFQSIPKSHYISSSFWMPGRNFTTVLVKITPKISKAPQPYVNAPHCESLEVWIQRPAKRLFYRKECGFGKGQ